MDNTDFVFDPRLDADFLFSIYEGDLEHAQVIFEQYVSTAPSQMNEIDCFYKEGTIEAFRQKVHKLKPIFSFVGLTGLTGQAEAIEKKCKEISNIYEVGSMYDRFKSDFSAYLPVIENELERLKR